jgi:hypothetical protein
LHSSATFRRVAIPDLRDTKGVRIALANRLPRTEADGELTRSIEFLTTPLVTSSLQPDVVAHDPSTFRMPRLSKFFNAPIAKLRRFSPELFTRKADKKFQKKKKLARGGAW